MSGLTTAQILDAVDGKLRVSEEWLDVFEYQNITGDPKRETLVMKAVARFLESQKPGASWEAETMGRLVSDHLAGGLWDSAEELGRTRAAEALADEEITQAGHDAIEAANGWEAYAYRKPGEHIFPVEGLPGAIISIVDLESVDNLTV